MSYVKLPAALLISFLLLGCADQDIPPFPDVELCKLVPKPTPHCLCVTVNTDVVTSYPDPLECNVSLRPGGWSTIKAYADELEKRLKKSQRKPFEKFNAVEEKWQQL